MGIGIVIAGIVAYIAWQQYKIERDKLRFSFYDRRLKVFESLMDLFVTIGENGKVNDEIWNKYHIGKTEAPFLFDSEVSDYIKKVDRNALGLLFACNTPKDLPAGEERSKKAKEISKLIQWFSTEHVHVTSKFEKYFKFEQKLEGKAMNWKRGFRRFAFVSTILIALICAGLSIVLILAERGDAQSYLRWKKENYIKNYCYGITPEQASAELERRKQINEIRIKFQKQGVELPSSEPELKLIDLGPATVEEVYEKELKEQQKQKAEMELRELKNGFWVKLSKSGLIGLCVAGGLVGGIVGFVIVWLIYKLLKWLVLGFCDNPKDKQKQ